MAGRPRKSSMFTDIKEIETPKEEPEKVAEEIKEEPKVADIPSDERRAVVKASVNPFLNVRNAPTSSSEKVGELLPGTVITIYEEKKGFGKISDTEDKWVSLDFVD